MATMIIVSFFYLFLLGLPHDREAELGELVGIPPVLIAFFSANTRVVTCMLPASDADSLC